MNPRFFVVPVAIVLAGVGWFVSRSNRHAVESRAATVAVPAVQDDWCLQSRQRGGWYCAVRELSLSASGGAQLNASPNGDIRVEGWDQDEVFVRARVQGKAKTEAKAFELVSAVQFEAAGSALKAVGPKTGRGESWSVSYRASVPHQTDLDLVATNGGIAVAEVAGTIGFRTTNGSVVLESVGGTVEGRTVNGTIKVGLSGTEWTGTGLDVRTTNGAINLAVPEGYNAVLEAAVTNGGIKSEIPLTVTGRIGRRLRTELGAGGALIKATTTNGGVTIRRP